MLKFRARPAEPKIADASQRENDFVAPHQLAKQIAAARWTGQDGLIVQVAHHVHRQPGGRVIPPRTLLIHRLHDYPVEIARQLRCEALAIRPAIRRDFRTLLRRSHFERRGRRLGLLLPNDAAHLIHWIICKAL